MIQRIDRLGVELPPPSEPDPNGAAAVQELMGGKFGEMSTFMNYSFQSFNFRGRQSARPFYDLVANIAAEEFGHIELVAATINTMLTGASPIDDGKAPKASLAGVKDARMSHHYLLGGQGALCADSQGRPWTGDNVFSSGDLIEDLTHNYFLETGARSGKLRVYEMVEHPAARALTGYLLVRGGVHQVAYARALENLTGADMAKLFPSPEHPDGEDPRVPAAHQGGPAQEALPLLAERLPGALGRLQRPAPGDGRPARGHRRHARGLPADGPPAAAGRLRAGLQPGGHRGGRREAARGRRPAEGAHRRRRERPVRRGRAASRRS